MGNSQVSVGFALGPPSQPRDWQRFAFLLLGVGSGEPPCFRQSQNNGQNVSPVRRRHGGSTGIGDWAKWSSASKSHAQVSPPPTGGAVTTGRGTQKNPRSPQLPGPHLALPFPSCHSQRQMIPLFPRRSATLAQSETTQAQGANRSEVTVHTCLVPPRPSGSRDIITCVLVAHAA